MGRTKSSVLTTTREGYPVRLTTTRDSKGKISFAFVVESQDALAAVERELNELIGEPRIIVAPRRKKKRRRAQ